MANTIDGLNGQNVLFVCKICLRFLRRLNLLQSESVKKQKIPSRTHTHTHTHTPVNGVRTFQNVISPLQQNI